MERVEWAKLEYAYGKATNVSELIRTIAFGDEAEACKACSTLYDELIHQASIYSSTGEAIPFLIEALTVARGGPRVRLGWLGFLEDIVSSSVHWIEMENDTDLAEAGLVTCPLPRECIERVWLGSGLFARLLSNDADADVRSRAAYLLGRLLGEGPDLAPRTPPSRFASAVAALTARLRGRLPPCG